MRVLITGGAGFIGHHVVERLMTTCDLILLDRLDHSGNLNRLAEVDALVEWVFHDLKAPLNSQVRKRIGPVDAIVHLAAATHVDRSIDDPMSFVLDNVVGTVNLLDFARSLKPMPRVIHFSTDEVFGPAPPGVAYKEDDRYRSGNPYAASKAGAEEIAVSYHNTYKLPVIITHTMNVIGRRQHPEKFFPNTIRKILRGETVTIHSDPTKTKAGSRFYIEADVVAAAVEFLLALGIDGQKYNIVGSEEVDNLELARRIDRAVRLWVTDVPEFKHEMVDFHSSRPGHDLRYALDGAKLRDAGFEVPRRLSVNDLVKWYVENPIWLED